VNIDDEAKEHRLDFEAPENRKNRHLSAQLGGNQLVGERAAGGAEHSH
jgi:hypothetical protein